MCEANNRERDEFTKELVNITDEYISAVARAKFYLALKLHEGYEDPNNFDVVSLVNETEEEIANAKRKSDEETAFLIRQHFLV